MNDKEKLQYLYEKEKEKERNKERRQGRVLSAGGVVGYSVIVVFKIVVMSFLPFLLFYFILGINGFLLVVLSLIAGVFLFCEKEKKDFKEEAGNMAMMEEARNDYPQLMIKEEYQNLTIEEKNYILQRVGMNGLNEKSWYVNIEMIIATDDLIENFSQYSPEVCKTIMEVSDIDIRSIGRLLESSIYEGMKANGIKSPGLVPTINYAITVRNVALMLKIRLKYYSPCVYEKITQKQADEINEMISEEMKEKREPVVSIEDLS